ncbi:MAG: bifunctional glutamate N-acetyltransferase/amino-acid acetyltransferase ArgJ [Acidimicrobiia bacterium]|nr:bifunctional glutamate N-acetyltransferase/amino-acid acetyltransferase ArgJ [Acidimicrobiia bacterium]
MSVTAPAGFKATGLHAGIKADGALDTSIIVASRPVAAAAVFTTSLTAAPVVTLARKHMADPIVQVIVINSGCANAGTGLVGLTNAERVAVAAAAVAGCDPDQVIVASTGPIGTPLPVDNVIDRLPEAFAAAGGADHDATLAARGILTTDSVSKEAVRRTGGYVIGGMSKGAGMVRPNMATMLAYLTTDAVVEPGPLQTALADAVDATFNSLNIDGCQSTNDMVVLLASGESGVAPDPSGFGATLTDVCGDLAWQMAKDAEGASRVVTVRVAGASDDRVAREIGKSIADSSLVRSSFYGADPNWGRVLGALGVTGHPIHQEDIEISYAGTAVAQGGVGIPFDEDAVIAKLERGDFELDIVVGAGAGHATIVTTDLTPEYVMFNGERT